MADGFIFSWAENAEGKIVNVDSVPGGLACGCICPNCHEPLLARHGRKKAHCFAHHSEDRGSNLKMCYKVILYKLAEQIIKTQKRIHAPSYYGIYGGGVIEFEDVRIDGQYERLDKQPDVIATTKDGKQYLIEFVYEYKVLHKNPIDYKNMNCLVVDLSHQWLESLERFLLTSSKDRYWINNEDYFNRIENTYRDKGINVKTIPESVCETCEIKNSCCAVMRVMNNPFVIENNGERYRLCRRDDYQRVIEAEKNRQQEEERIRQAKLAWYEEQLRLQEERNKRMEQDPQAEKTCYQCQNNLEWANKADGWCFCGCFRSVGLPRQRVNPDYAKQCRGFRWK